MYECTFVRLRRLTSALMLLAASAGAQPAGPFYPIDERIITRAIADKKADSCYDVRTPTWEIRYGGAVTFGCLTTPYSRVVALSQAAARAYKPFTAADVPADLVEPYFELIAFPAADKKVEAIVLAKKGSKGLDGIIRPTASTETPATFQNLYGAKWEGSGMVARFNLSDLRDGYEIRVVRGGAEFKSALKPEKIR